MAEAKHFRLKRDVSNIFLYMYIYILFPEANLFRLIVDLFNAGTDTTANTMSWAIIHLIKNPEVQKKCRKEILEVDLIDTLSSQSIYTDTDY
jgi:hypothetical protein